MTLFDALFESIRGRVDYLDYHPSDNVQIHPRIVISVTFGKQYRTFCIVDTGTPYCILAPQIAVRLDLRPQDALDSFDLVVRGIRFFGHLHRVQITLEALEGEPLATDATVFVPEIDGPPYKLPSFLGLQGYLDRIRFAIDPVTNSFFFGAI